MSKWYIEVDGNTHDFFQWKEAQRVWDLLKSSAPGTAFLCRRARDGGTITLDCA